MVWPPPDPHGGIYTYDVDGGRTCTIKMKRRQSEGISTVYYRVVPGDGWKQLIQVTDKSMTDAMVQQLEVTNSTEAADCTM
eukprot:2745227-Pyramimonas_sp.AAC.1